MKLEQLLRWQRNMIFPKLNSQTPSPSPLLQFRAHVCAKIQCSCGGGMYPAGNSPVYSQKEKIKQKSQPPEHQMIGFNFCGAGGIRTRVRTKRRNAFYMLSS